MHFSGRTKPSLMKQEEQRFVSSVKGPTKQSSGQLSVSSNPASQIPSLQQPEIGV